MGLQSRWAYAGDGISETVFHQFTVHTQIQMWVLAVYCPCASLLQFTIAIQSSLLNNNKSQHLHTIIGESSLEMNVCFQPFHIQIGILQSSVYVCVLHTLHV